MKKSEVEKTEMFNFMMNHDKSLHLAFQTSATVQID